jgi:hypothetical protein
MTREELERSLVQGEQIFVRGSTPRELFIVRSGRVRLRGAEGTPDRLRRAGEMFGELSAILGTPSPYSAEALEPSAVLSLPLGVLNKLCTGCPEFSLRLITYLARELAADAVGGIVADSTPPVAAPRGELEEWVARLVPVLMRRQVPGDIPLLVPGTLRELATDADLPLRATYEALHNLLDRGFLQLVDDQLSVLEPEALAGLRCA